MRTTAAGFARLATSAPRVLWLPLPRETDNARGSFPNSTQPSSRAWIYPKMFELIPLRKVRSTPCNSSSTCPSEKPPVAYWQTLNTFWTMTLRETRQIYSRKYTVSTRLCVTSSQNSPSLTWNFQRLPQKFNSQTHKANETSTRK